MGQRAVGEAPQEPPSASPPQTRSHAEGNIEKLYLFQLVYNRKKNHNIKSGNGAQETETHSPAWVQSGSAPLPPGGTPTLCPHCGTAPTPELQHNSPTAHSNENTSHVANAPHTPRSEVRIVPPHG